MPSLLIGVENRIKKIIEKSIDQENVFGTVVCLGKGSDSITFSAGNLKNQSQFYIASVTKLFVTAIILKLESDARLNLDDQIAAFLPKSVMKGLHVYKGVDYSDQLSVRHLLSHTSGLPDYFLQKRKDGTCLVRELISGKDQRWTAEEAIEVAKEMQPHFRPGQKGKAFYSDTNFQLLGLIIEKITGKSFNDVLDEYVLSPLGLHNTYLYEDPKDTRPEAIYYRQDYARIPNAMISFWADGGIVSTVHDTMTFLKAFFKGYFFPKEYIQKMRCWNRIFSPFWYGLGMVRFKLPWFFSPLKPVPELMGHMGTTGAFAYYCPKKELYITGTINQVHNASLPYKLIVDILKAL